MIPLSEVSHALSMRTEQSLGSSWHDRFGAAGMPPRPPEQCSCGSSRCPKWSESKRRRTSTTLHRRVFSRSLGCLERPYCVGGHGVRIFRANPSEMRSSTPGCARPNRVCSCQAKLRKRLRRFGCSSLAAETYPLGSPITSHARFSRAHVSVLCSRARRRVSRVASRAPIASTRSSSRHVHRRLRDPGYSPERTEF